VRENKKNLNFFGLVKRRCTQREGYEKETPGNFSKTLFIKKHKKGVPS
jgi:hypothetical protein